MTCPARLFVHTLAFKNKLLVPSKLTQTQGTTVSNLRQWVADKLNFPVAEATLIVGGRRLKDDTLLSNLESSDLHLVCTAPTDESSLAKVKIYVKDTTRTPNKMYAVKMEPTQGVSDLKTKLYEKSSCTVPADLQLLTCRGKAVDGSFSLREYIITQRRDRIVFYLSKDPSKLGHEEMQLNVVIPTDGAVAKVRLQANNKVKDLLTILKRSHGLHKQATVLNAAGLVLLDDMTIRHACTMPMQAPGAPAPLLNDWVKAGSTNLNLFCIHFPREKLLQGVQDVLGAEVFLNPEHHAALGIVNPATSKRKASGKTCASLKGFKGLFRKKKTVKKQPLTSSTQSNSAKEDKAEPKNLKKTKKKKNSYKSRMRAMMKSTHRSREDELEQYRRKISSNLGGGEYKRIDSI